MKTSIFSIALAAACAALGILSSAQAGREEAVVSIKATKRIAEETSAPLRRINFVGEFTVSRTGPTENSLPVWVHVSGSASPRADYEPIPWLVTIPEGESSVSVPVVALRDDEAEGIETVIAQVSNCPPEGSLAPCYAFAIDPLSERDTVFIREDGLSVATVHITNPADGSFFESGEAILIEATAIHLESFISRVEFFDGETRIGVSEIFFVRAPDPGTPIHHQFAWQRVGAGGHTLTARAMGGERMPIVSSPVRIRVGEDPRNQSPRVGISSPRGGTQFREGSTVEIVVESSDPDGYVPLMEFHANGRKIGEQAVNFLVEPPPGQPQRFSFSWRDVPAGGQVLTAVATDNEGARGESLPVGIRVIPEDTNQSPVIEIASPANGEVFQVGDAIPIVVEGADRDGYIPRVEFFADGRKIGEVNISFFVAPPPGQAQRFEYLWEDATPGGHVLTARATDNDGGRGGARAVGITVANSDALPVLGVVARDAFAVEPVPGAPLNTATFRIVRHDGSEGDLRVQYSLHGRAENGVDYEELSGVAIIAEGSRFVDVVVSPLSDREAEGRESVILRLEENSTYRVGRNGRAVALISDRSWIHRSPGLRCIKIGDGLVHFCVPLPSGRRCRVEGSEDLNRWRTLLELEAVDGAVHFVAEVTPGRRIHFCRIVEDDGE